jgi:hypothetical protein
MGLHYLAFNLPGVYYRPFLKFSKQEGTYYLNSNNKSEYLIECKILSKMLCLIKERYQLLGIPCCIL